MWILAWNGRILARHGISWDQETGVGWYEVPNPFPEETFSHISVGAHCAWAVGKENQVWLRTGLDSSILGSGWTAMVGRMSLVFNSDWQVCGLSCEDQQLYLRTGIKSQEMGGQTWKLIADARTSDSSFMFTWVTFDCKGFLLRLEDSGSSAAKSEPWREQILQSLRHRSHQDDQFSEYAQAVETREWVNCGRALLGHQWVDLHLRCSEPPFLMIASQRISIAEITAIRCHVDRTLIIHRSMNLLPIRLTFATEKDMEDWAAQLTKSCWISRNNNGSFLRSAWALTALGDIFFNEHQTEVADCDHIDMLSNGHRPGEVFIHPLSDGFYRGCSVIVDGTVSEDATRFSVNFQCGNTVEPNEAHHSKRDVALHINPRFDGSSVVVVRNSYAHGIWDDEEILGTFDIRPGGQFNLSVTCQRQDFRVPTKFPSF